MFLFAPKVRNNLFIFGGEVFGLCQEEKSLEVGTWKGRLEEPGTRGSGWKSQVEVTMMALVGGGGVFRLLVFFLVGDDGVPGYPIKKGGEVMVVDFSEMRIFGVIWRYQKFSNNVEVLFSSDREKIAAFS